MFEREKVEGVIDKINAAKITRRLFIGVSLASAGLVTTEFLVSQQAKESEALEGCEAEKIFELLFELNENEVDKNRLVVLFSGFAQGIYDKEDRSVYASKIIAEAYSLYSPDRNKSMNYTIMRDRDMLGFSEDEHGHDTSTVHDHPALIIKKSRFVNSSTTLNARLYSVHAANYERRRVVKFKSDIYGALAKDTTDTLINYTGGDSRTEVAKDVNHSPGKPPLEYQIKFISDGNVFATREQTFRNTGPSQTGTQDENGNFVVLDNPQTLYNRYFELLGLT